jgi:hypothetical protein
MIRKLVQILRNNDDHLHRILNIHGVKFSSDDMLITGRGSFADVYRGQYQGGDVAIKRFHVFTKDDLKTKIYKVTLA